MSEKKPQSIITRYMTMCVICNRPAEHIHHCLSGSSRRFADSANITIPLCASCHNLFSEDRTIPKGKNGKAHGQTCDIHHCRKMEKLAKMLGQLAYEKQYIIDKYSLPFTEDSDEAREAFRKANGESYL